MKRNIIAILFVLMMLVGTGAAFAVTGPEPNNPANIIITKSADKTSGYIGDTFTFTVTVKNPNADNGMNDYTNVVISDTVPAGLEVTGASGGVVSGNTVTYDVGTLAAGQEKILTITVKALAEGKYDNVANVKYTVNEGTAAWQETIHHEAVYETVHHDAIPAWTEKVWVPGHYETVTVEADHNGWTLQGNGEFMKKGSDKIFAKYHQGETLNGFISKPVGNSDPTQSKDWKWEPVMVTKEKWVPGHCEKIYHEEIPAWDEQVLVKEAYDEIVKHDQVNDFKVREASVKLDPQIEVLPQIVPEPVTPEEPAKVTPQPEKTVPMETTGAEIPLLILGVLMLVAGGILAYSRRM